MFTGDVLSAGLLKEQFSRGTTAALSTDIYRHDAAGLSKHRCANRRIFAERAVCQRDSGTPPQTQWCEKQLYVYCGTASACQDQHVNLTQSEVITFLDDVSKSQRSQNARNTLFLLAALFLVFVCQSRRTGIHTKAMQLHVNACFHVDSHRHLSVFCLWRYSSSNADVCLPLGYRIFQQLLNPCRTKTLSMATDTQARRWPNACLNGSHPCPTMSKFFRFGEITPILLHAR